MKCALANRTDNEKKEIYVKKDKNVQMERKCNLKYPIYIKKLINTSIVFNRPNAAPDHSKIDVITGTVSC